MLLALPPPRKCEGAVTECLSHLSENGKGNELHKLSTMTCLNIQGLRVRLENFTLSKSQIYEASGRAAHFIL